MHGFNFWHEERAKEWDKEKFDRENVNWPKVIWQILNNDKDIKNNEFELMLKMFPGINYFTIQKKLKDTLMENDAFRKAHPPLSLNLRNFNG